MEPVTVREDVSSPAWFPGGVSRRLVRKSNGELWCCYTFHNPITDREEIHCSYSTDDGATWTSEPVVGGASDDYHFPALAVDSANNLHLVYGHWSDIGPTETLEYKKRTGGGWDAGADKVLDTDIDLGYGSSVAVDSSDNIHVAWCLYPGGLRYREKIGDVWQDTEEVTAWGSFYGVSMAIDSSDDIHIAYDRTGAEGVPIEIYYIKKTAGVWGVAQELTGVHYQANPSIAIDSSGNVHVAWWGVPSGIYYTMWDVALGAWWPPQYIAGAKYPSVAVDDDDLVQIFCCYDNSLLRLWKTGLDWDGEEIIRVSPNYYPSAIWAMWPMVGGIRTNVLDGFSVIWTCGSSYDLLYWAFPGPVPVPELIGEYSLVQQELLDLLRVG